MAQPVQITIPTAGIEAGLMDVPVTSLNPLAVAPTPTRGIFADRSGSIAAGTVSQQVAAINTARLRILVENPATATSQGISTAESLFLNFGTAAAANSTSIEITPGGSYDSESGPVTTQTINVVANTTGHLFITKEM